jgi:NADH:ubiquinone oxidoreductase subunit E
MPTASLESILAGRKSQPHQLIEVLQDVQENLGYISADTMRMVSQDLGVPLMEVYRVTNFYKTFSLKPRGKHVITICMGTACHVRGAHLMLDQVLGQLGLQPGSTTEDGLITVERVNCLGACALGPVAVHNGNYYHHMTPNKLRKLIQLIRSTNMEEPAHA